MNPNARQECASADNKGGERKRLFNSVARKQTLNYSVPRIHLRGLEILSPRDRSPLPGFYGL